MTVQTKVFGSTNWFRYRVELDTWRENDEPRSDCIIYHDPYGTQRNTGCQASLSCAQDTGYLESTTGRMHKMEPGLLIDIDKWAKENGY